MVLIAESTCLKLEYYTDLADFGNCNEQLDHFNLEFIHQVVQTDVLSCIALPTNDVYNASTRVGSPSG